MTRCHTHRVRDRENPATTELWMIRKGQTKPLLQDPVGKLEQVLLFGSISDSGYKYLQGCFSDFLARTFASIPQQSVSEQDTDYQSKTARPALAGAWDGFGSAISGQQTWQQERRRSSLRTLERSGGSPATCPHEVQSRYGLPPTSPIEAPTGIGDAMPFRNLNRSLSVESTRVVFSAMMVR